MMTPRHLWWKILAALLFLVVLHRGLLTPLKHGLVNVQPSRFLAGEDISFDIYAYNSNYDVCKDSIQVYLRPVPGDIHGSSILMLAANKVEAIDHAKLRAFFKLPNFNPDIVGVSLFSVLVDNPVG